jgi:hypothetical protein
MGEKSLQLYLYQESNNQNIKEIQELNSPQNQQPNEEIVK